MMGGRGPGTMGTGPGMMGGDPGMMGGQWNTRSYLDALKQELAITPNQESAWKAYADTVSDAGEQMQGLHQTMFEFDGYGLMAGASDHDESDVQGSSAGIRQRP